MKSTIFRPASATSADSAPQPSPIAASTHSLRPSLVLLNFQPFNLVARKPQRHLRFDRCIISDSCPRSSAFVPSMKSDCSVKVRQQCHTHPFELTLYVISSLLP
eukprot:TRINITY_DN2932_c0_g1_i2.p1 TRINITY_DN2932_c0_g1~~TRINITY_DN2932_c0_g1_i2.p1  ORF type:complete len:104 (+),score=8.99 TRINITY_DN2932_c0_g1_i2:1060-1371(+)